MSLERSVSVLMYAVTIYSRMQFLQQLRIVIIIYPKGQFIKFAHLVSVFLFFAVCFFLLHSEQKNSHHNAYHLCYFL
jgi:hypothetical protein